jgi:hypothetical protein
MKMMLFPAMGAGLNGLHQKAKSYTAVQCRHRDVPRGPKQSSPLTA